MTKKGNSAGITVLRHSSIPSAAPVIAVLLSRIRIRNPNAEKILVNRLCWVKFLTSKESMQNALPSFIS